MTANLVAGLFGVMAVAGAVTVAFTRHVLHAVIALGVSLFGVAGLFLFLGSPFVAAMQVLIYIGGISVAMVFAMMLSVSMARKMDFAIRKTALALTAAGVFFAGAASVIVRSSFPTVPDRGAEAWKVERIGQAFMGDYNVVFEALSLVLLLAIIGAVLIAQREPVAE